MTGKFTVLKITEFSSIDENTVLPKSDLAIQDDKKIYQFKYHSSKKEKKKTVIKPGIWTFANSMNGIKLEETELRQRKLMLEAIDAEAIVNESKTFFSKLDIYEELQRPKKRGILVYSKPGMGKSSTISHFCLETIKEDPGTVILIWPTSKIEADDVNYFLANNSKYSKNATKLVMLLEDIGGAEYENGGRANAVDSGILNLLDGVAVTFKLPTLIIATTNYPENLLSSLADRPGRFDMMFEVKAPSAEARVKLLEFISKKELSEEDKKMFMNSRCDGLSIAHLDEIVVRSRLHDKTLKETLNEILNHREKVKESFSKASRSMGFDTDHDF
jgi:SpoVK/Ycf46/Vps4 family AAA+-type ATPase